MRLFLGARLQTGRHCGGSKLGSRVWRGAQSRRMATSAAAAAAPQQQLRTCRRCKQQFSLAHNTETSCRYHTSLYTGGELAKAIGFCRESSAPEHQLRIVHGRTGLLRFWDCCGAEADSAPGCCTGRHITFDDPETL